MTIFPEVISEAGAWWGQTAGRCLGGVRSQRKTARDSFCGSVALLASHFRTLLSGMACYTREELLRCWHDAVSTYQAIVEQMAEAAGPEYDALRKQSQTAHVGCGEARTRLDEHERVHGCKPTPQLG